MRSLSLWILLPTLASCRCSLTTSGCHGRCLLKDILELNFRTDVRLEPSCELPNVGSFDDLVPRLLVCHLLAAIRTDDCQASAPRVILLQTVTVDILHTLHSGIFAECCKHTVWQLLGAEIWGDGTMTHEEKLHVRVLALRAGLGDLVRRTEAITPARNPRPGARPQASPSYAPMRA